MYFPPKRPKVDFKKILQLKIQICLAFSDHFKSYFRQCYTAQVLSHCFLLAKLVIVYLQKKLIMHTKLNRWQCMYYSVFTDPQTCWMDPFLARIYRKILKYIQIGHFILMWKTLNYIQFFLHCLICCFKVHLHIRFPMRFPHCVTIFYYLPWLSKTKESSKKL